MTESREPNKATKRLWQVTLQRHRAELEELSVLAVEADGLDYKDGWRFDVANGVLVKVES